MSIFSKASGASYWRGFHYFEDGNVKDIKQIAEGVYSAKVEGSEMYSVTINLEHPGQCTCTCPFVEGNKKICKHMVALAFAVSPLDYKEACRARDAYEREQEAKEKRYEARLKEHQKRMEEKKKMFLEYVARLTEEEAKQELLEILLKEASNEDYDLYVDEEDYDYD